MYTQQTGSALAISLVLLTAITLISITSLQRSGLQTRIVANSQHAEAAFHAANSELEGMLEAYANDPVAASALQATTDQFTMVKGVKIYTITSTTGVTSSYQANAQGKPYHIQIANRIVHRGQPAFSAGNSQGSFATYQFEASSTSSDPVSGRTLSDQSIGIEFIAPALN